MDSQSQPVVAGKKPIVMELEPGKYHWCTCGLSANQPFCNGAHKGSGFVPMTFEIAEKKQVAICACKQTGNSPFCDGAHSKLSVTETLS
jgi:CDGSH iron-sulfur domain-containing protein 3